MSASAQSLQRLVENVNTAKNERPILEIDDDDEALLSKGYRKIRVITKTLQGILYEAVNIETNLCVAIKKVSKRICKQKISVQNGMNIVVEESIQKEAILLNHLTVSNKCIGGYIVTFKDFFELNGSYYLITEYVDGETNIKCFVDECMRYIQNKQLDIGEYHNMIKYLCWQLATVIYWLHNDMNCCHLEIKMENILLQNVKTRIDENGAVHIDPSMSIKLIDFGLAEIFKNDKFECSKHIYGDIYSSPNAFAGDIYDARANDMWSFGVVVYYMNIGILPYVYPDYETDVGYQCISDRNILKYIEMNNLSTFVDSKLIELLTNLLDTNPQTRLNSVQLLKSKFFKYYFRRYKQTITETSIYQRKKNRKYLNKIQDLPFYSEDE